MFILTVTPCMQFLIKLEILYISREITTCGMSQATAFQRGTNTVAFLILCTRVDRALIIVFKEREMNLLLRPANFNLGRKLVI